MGRKRPMMNLAAWVGMQPGELPKTVQAMGITGEYRQIVFQPSTDRRCAALQNAQRSGLNWFIKVKKYR
jgi:heat shock protein HtpX